MSNNTEYLLEYHEIIKQMGEASVKVNEVANKLEEESELVALHDNNDGAHPYIQNLIKSINTVTPVDVQSLINAHAIGSTGHEDIRAEIRAVSNSVTTSTQIVDNALADHNASISAHPDIRSTLSIHDEALVIVRNNEDHLNQLDVLFKAMGITPGQNGEDGEDGEDGSDGAIVPSDGSVAGDIQALETNVAILTASTSVNRSDIGTLKEDTDFIQNTQIAELNNNDSSIFKRLSDLEIAVANVSGNMGNVGSGSGVDLSDMVCTIPSVVKPGESYTFTFTGFIKPTEDEIVKININPGSSQFVFSKMSEVALDEELQVTIPADLSPGIIKNFSATVTLEVADASSLITFPIKINSLPNTAMMKHTLPSLVEPGKEYEFSISGATDSDGQTITYSIDTADSTLTFSKSVGISENEVIKAIVPADAVRGHEFVFDVSAIDSLGGASVKSMKGGTVNIVPTIEGLVHNMPSVVKPGTSYHVSFEGAVALDGSPITYSLEIVESDSPIAFSDREGILPGAKVILSVDSNAPNRGVTYTVRIIAVDAHGAEVSTQVSVKINELPSSNDIAISLPNSVNGGQTIQDVVITGGYDIDTTQTLTYEIVAQSSILGFSKTKNIKSNEKIYVNVPLVLVATPMTFYIDVYDSVGEKALEPKYFTVNVQARSRTSQPTVLYPENSQMNVPYSGFTVQISEYDTELDL